ncbi:MAG: PASTA domain-containing protein [Candidatus Eremiobacteraeota bacterium]|nr:PASTA domain-containing protein [Candidatus Eremiobacteraeota bacterium]
MPLESSTIAVSDMRHHQVAAAESHLRSAGFVPVATSRTSQTAPSGTVIDQMPAAGTGLHAGDTVHLAVSSGPPLVAIPNLVGHTMLDAGIVLKRTKLRPTFAARIRSRRLAA